MLKLDHVTAWYGVSQALFDINLEVPRGSVVALLGRNGAGKSTTLKAIMGLVRRKGAILFEGNDIASSPTRKVARSGIAYCPEERAVFGSLTVRENFFLPPVVREGGMSTEEIFSIFPNLPERLESPGKKLSGGEQQMLAIGRILRTGAPMLLLDEPTEGLAPAIIKQIGVALRALKGRGMTILLVEQNFHFASTIADFHYVIENGRTVARIANADIEAERSVLERYLGV